MAAPSRDAARPASTSRANAGGARSVVSDQPGRGVARPVAAGERVPAAGLLHRPRQLLRVAQHERAAVRQLQRAVAAQHRAVVPAGAVEPPLGAEEEPHRLRRLERAAVDGDERRAGTTGGLVDLRGDEELAGAGLAADQDRSRVPRAAATCSRTGFIAPLSATIGPASRCGSIRTFSARACW